MLGLYFHFFNMRQYIYFLVCVVLIGCNTPKKLHRMMDNLPEASAKECAIRFPIKETIDTIEITDNELISAYEREYAEMYAMIDSLINTKCDTVYRDKIIEIIKKIPSKPEIKHIIKTQESTAKQQVILDSCQKVSSLLNKKLDNCDKKVNELVAKCDRYKRQRNRYLWILIALIIFSFRRQILKLIA